MSSRHRLFFSLLPVLGLLSACAGESLPILSAASSFVDFGEVAVGESASGTVRVANVGAADAEIGQPTISGDEAAAFALVGGEWPMSLVAGGTAEIEVSFSSC